MLFGVILLVYQDFWDPVRFVVMSMREQEYRLTVIIDGSIYEKQWPYPKNLQQIVLLFKIHWWLN